MSEFLQPGFGPTRQPMPGAIEPAGTVIFTRPGRLDSEPALRSYLLSRAIGRAAVNLLLWSGIAVLLVAAALWLSGLQVLGILIGLLAIPVLLLRGVLAGLGRRLSGADRLGDIEPQVGRLVARTGRGLRRELRRVGLPGSPLAPLLIALRLLRPRRRQATALALSRVELARVVPASQVDELHLLLQSHHG
jgi:hypothetical protein